jgi:hypothetical protein
MSTAAPTVSIMMNALTRTPSSKPPRSRVIEGREQGAEQDGDDSDRRPPPANGLSGWPARPPGHMQRHSQTGSYGAARTLTDADFRDGNERYIVSKLGGADSFAILMSVKILKNRVMAPDFNS